MKEHSTPEKIEDIEIRLLLEALYGTYHYDFRNYAMASIKGVSNRPASNSGS